MTYGISEVLKLMMLMTCWEAVQLHGPMSKLNIISKVIERLVHALWRPHLMHSDNFSRLQSAYRHGHSTEITLLHVHSAIDRRETIDGSCWTRYLRRVRRGHHQLLLRCLNRVFGVSGTILDWLTSCLEDQHQYIQLRVMCVWLSLTWSVEVISLDHTLSDITYKVRDSSPQSAD